jgi:hypothetical protein
MGVEIGSDWQDKTPGDPVFGLYRDGCGFWTKGEVGLLESIAAEFRGRWLEIGGHTGWCAKHIAAAPRTFDQNFVVSIEPMLINPEWYRRFSDNLAYHYGEGHSNAIMPWAGKSDDYFRISDTRQFVGACIDGDHEHPHPLRDAINCFNRLEDRGVILLHDFRGPGPWEAGEFLASQGMQYKIYGSVHMVGVFWRGEFTPPAEIAEGKSSDEWIQHYGRPGWAG